MSELDMITLHRSAEREVIFSEPHPPFFDPTIKAWVVTGATHCEAMLLSPHLMVAPYLPAYEAMAKRNPDYAFENLLFAFKYIPMCLNGEGHKVARRAIAEYVAGRKAQVSTAAPVLVNRWFGKLASSNKIELMAEVIEPLVKDVLGTLNQIDDVAFDAVRSASAVFDRMMGAKKRRVLDNELAKIRKNIRRGLGPNATEEQEGYCLALFILGNDALAGTLGESLHQIFRESPGRRLSEIDYPTIPNATGVPFVERLVAEPFDYEGIAFHKGERVRILLQSFQFSSQPADRIRIFGAGIHACLGRQLSLEIWSLITRTLSEMADRVEIIEYALRDADYVFSYPSRFVVALKR
jgi:cytochrome P450